MNQRLSVAYVVDRIGIDDRGIDNPVLQLIDDAIQRRIRADDYGFDGCSGSYEFSQCSMVDGISQHRDSFAMQVFRARYIVAATADDDGSGMKIIARLFERRIDSDVACVDPCRDDIASARAQPFQYLLICFAHEKLDAESTLSGKKADQFVFEADGLAAPQKIILRIDPRNDA